jgi:hypothetical protein
MGKLARGLMVVFFIVAMYALAFRAPLPKRASLRTPPNMPRLGRLKSSVDDDVKKDDDALTYRLLVAILFL